jgi:cytochrome b pre-mRNA-processing protein 3
MAAVMLARSRKALLTSSWATLASSVRTNNADCATLLAHRIPRTQLSHSRAFSGKKDANEAVVSAAAEGKKSRRQHEVGLSEKGSRFQWLLKLMGYYGKESTIIRSSGILYLNARAVASSEEFLLQFDLDATWENEFYVNCLHLWMIFVRIRKEGPGMKQLSQEVFDNFWQDMQKGMYHNLGVQSLALNTRTRELQNVFYGSAVSYDFALGTSDAVLGAALYRNLFGLEGRAVHVNKMTAYVRKQLQLLEVRPLHLPPVLYRRTLAFFPRFLFHMHLKETELFACL